MNNKKHKHFQSYESTFSFHIEKAQIIYPHTVIQKFSKLVLSIYTFVHTSLFTPGTLVGFLLHYPAFINNPPKTSPKMFQIRQKHYFWRFEQCFWREKTCFWHIILCFWHFFAKFRVSHFAKNRLLQKYYVVANLIFPVCRFYFFLPLLPLSHLISPISTLFSLSSSQISSHENMLCNLSKQLLKLQKILPEKHLRKHSLPPPLPERKRERLPEKPLFLGFLKGSGEEETRKEKEEEEEKPRAIRWLGKVQSGGGGRPKRKGEEKSLAGRKTPSKALIIILFLLHRRKN